MRRLLTLPRLAVAGAAALALAVAPAVPAAAAEARSHDPFFAEYRDGCVSAHTNGTISWPDPSGGRPAVHLQGTVAQNYFCNEIDLRTTFADFRAMSGNQIVDHRLEAVGLNSVRLFDFRLSALQVDRVEVRVCHDLLFTPEPPWVAPRLNCGETEFLFPPPHIPPPPTPTPVPQAG